MEELKDILSMLIKEDQNAIRSFRKEEISQQEFKRISSKVSKEFLAALKTSGFPYHDVAAEDTYRAAVTLSLHLDQEDLRIIFSDYIDGQPTEKIDPDHKAMFIDKIRILSGKPQLYGTQYRVKKDKGIELLPLENKLDIDKIRKEAGLQPLSKYLESARRALK